MARKKDLHALIRLRKWEVDEKQRALAVLLRAEESVLARQQALEDGLARERAFVSDAPPDRRMTFEPFLRRCALRREQLAAELVEVRTRIFAAQEELAEAYRRLKTFEITQQSRDRARAAEDNRVEQIGLDEIGLTLHRRKAAAPAA
jgi:flagellar export protein FliJ